MGKYDQNSASKPRESSIFLDPLHAEKVGTYVALELEQTEKDTVLVLVNEERGGYKKSHHARDGACTTRHQWLW